MKFLLIITLMISTSAWAAKQDEVRVKLPSEMIRASIQEQSPPEPTRASGISMEAPNPFHPIERRAIAGECRCGDWRKR